MISFKLKLLSFYLICLGGISFSYAQTNSVLSTGSWFKFSVTQDGVFKLDYTALKNAGVNPDQINPKNIQVFTGTHGMLPQSNAINRKNDLTEIAITVSGEEDEKFNTSDYILFYAKGADQNEYDISRQTFRYENNLYDDKNFYFLTIGQTNGKRISNIDNISGSFPVVNTFDDFAYYETEKYNLLKSGRHWFGEQFDASLEATIRFNITGIVENSDIKLISHVMAQSITNTSFQVSMNNSPILTQPIDAIPNTSYSLKGRVKADTITFSSSQVNAASRQNQDIKYQFTKGGPGISIGYLDFFLFSFKRKLALYDAQTTFRSFQSLAQPVTTFEVESVTSSTRVWNVSNTDSALNQSFIFSGNKLSFSATSEQLQSFVAFNPANIKSPVFEGKVTNQNLHNTIAPDLLIITNKKLTEEANRLAAHRQSHSGLSAKVVTTEEVFNEYSSGRQDVSALRDYIRSLYVQPSSALKYVLLFGRGSYDYKNRVLGNTNLVPIYESRNSLSPLQTYASDDYYGFMEESEGEWSEAPAQNHSMDIGVGRIPVKNLEEARFVVDKLIEYDLKLTNAEAWQSEILFVADDGDFNLHQIQADQIANSIELYDATFTTRKFYLDNYEQLQRASGQYSPAATEALKREINKSALIVNFTGHGSEQVWMDERILDAEIISEWKQGPRYPLFITATCEFGRNDDPFQISSGEKTLLQKRGGAIGLVTTSRPVWSSSNELLNKKFYETLFSKQNGKFKRLGDIVKETKNLSYSDVFNRNFSLLGDPSLKLALPDEQVVIDQITTNSALNQLKGLSHVTINGHIENNGLSNTVFNGEINITLFDDFANHVTKGDENPPFNYIDRSNIFFRGNTSINQGSFQFEFIMPTNTPANPVVGKISSIATNKKNEYAGGAMSIDITGGIETNSPSDITPPVIRLFMGDTTFVNGGKVGPNTKLISLISDESGINHSESTSHNIIVRIDQGGEINLNEYYVANLDTYKRGSLTYPFYALEKGKHTLQLTVSDTYNNRTTAKIDFVVTDGTDIQIEEFINYPNPFRENTVLEFTHSRPGEDLEATLNIFDMAGHHILTKQYEITESQYRVTLSEWDGRNSEGGKLLSGIYLGKLSVRSLLDGSKNEQITKLIILN